MRVIRTHRSCFFGDDMLYHAMARPVKRGAPMPANAWSTFFGGAVFKYHTGGFMAHCQGNAYLCPSLGAARRRLHRMMRQEAKRRASTH
ncbi:hypothetical protein [Pseudomonas phage PA69]|uniref:Uncharacterized protein n=1 Tax=Pseudomonas phage PA69 TaxID=3073017 RepID=A0AAX4G0P7_9CAUD|nr:hypothetical protein [Pseudomonas phage PA69]